jgi:hypothetical protein
MATTQLVLGMQVSQSPSISPSCKESPQKAGNVEGCSENNAGPFQSHSSIGANAPAPRIKEEEILDVLAQKVPLATIKDRLEITQRWIERVKKSISEKVITPEPGKPGRKRKTIQPGEDVADDEDDSAGEEEKSIGSIQKDVSLRRQDSRAV